MLETLASIFVLYFSSNQHKVDIIRFTTNYNIANKFVKSNLIARACFIFLLRSWRQQTNPSRKKNWKCYKIIGSYVSCAFIEIWSTWEVWLRLEKLLRIFRALQTSRVFHISMNARSRMNQLLSLKHAIHFNWFCKEHWSLSIKRCLHRSQKFLSGSFNTTLYSTHVIT